MAAAIPAVKVADTKFNLIETKKQIAIAEGQGVEIIVFPELSITGYTCQASFSSSQLLLDDTESGCHRAARIYPPIRYHRHCRCTCSCGSIAP